MKNIGIILFILTIFGSANPLSVCYKPNNIMHKDKCIKSEINKMLAEKNEKLVGGKIVLVQMKNPPKRDYVIIEVAYSKDEKECKKIHIGLDKKLRKDGSRLKSILRAKDSNNLCSVRAAGNLTYSELQYFMKKNPKAKIINGFSNYVGASPISTAPNYNQDKMISSNINNMCIKLEQNYNKFNNSNVELRIREKAKRAYNECIRSQKEFRDFRKD